jgi:hypothetical protein
MDTIDRFLLRRMDPEEAEAFRVRMLVDTRLYADTARQRMAHQMIQLESIFEHLMREDRFRQEIYSIFP